jgi:hypothetical protein
LVTVRRDRRAQAIGWRRVISDFTSCSEIPYSKVSAPHHRAAIEFDLSKLTMSEEIWIWRKRQISPTGRRTSRCGSALSQREAAEVLKVPQYYYQEIETGRRPEREILSVRIKCFDGGELGELSGYELCLLARRRVGINLRALAICFHVSHSTILKWECSGAAKLVEFWIGRGFSFPQYFNQERNS